MAKQQAQETEKVRERAGGDAMAGLSQQVEQMKQMYAQVTGADPSRVPQAPIPPEASPGEYVRQNFEQLQQIIAMHGVSGQGTSDVAAARHQSCRVDIWESESRWQCAFELPGVVRNDVELDIDQGVLHLRATRRGVGAGDWRPMMVEMGPCTYERHIPLPPFVRAESASARYENGLLFVQFERVPETVQKQHKVPVS